MRVLQSLSLQNKLFIFIRRQQCKTNTKLILYNDKTNSSMYLNKPINRSMCLPFVFALALWKKKLCLKYVSILATWCNLTG